MPKWIILIVILNLLTGLGALILIWSGNITIERQFIPTIINGLATSTSIMVGFFATILTFMVTKQVGGYSISEFYFGLALIFMLFPLTILFMAYGILVVDAQPQKALRWAMTDLVVSFCLAFQVLVLYLGKLRDEAQKQ